MFNKLKIQQCTTVKENQLKFLVFGLVHANNAKFYKFYLKQMYS